MTYILEFVVVAVALALIGLCTSPKMNEVEMYKTKTIYLGGVDASSQIKTDSLLLLDKDSQGQDRQVGLVNLKMFEALVRKTNTVKITTSGNKAKITAHSANDLFGQDGRKWSQMIKNLPVEVHNNGREIWADIVIVDSTDVEYIRIPYQILEVVANSAK